MDGLDRLRNLHRDLVQLNESRLPNIERLVTELETHIEDFKRVLDKAAKNDKSRHTLLSGSIEVDGTPYKLNEEFIQQTLELAEVLNLDELEAAKLYLEGEDDSQGLDRSPLSSSIIVFHQRREFLLECIRLTLYLASQLDKEEDQIGSILLEVIGLILQSDKGAAVSGAAYWRKCFAGMGEIAKWLQNIAERVQSIVITGQVPSPEFIEIMDFQRESLLKQHQSLSAIISQLIKANHTNMEDFELLLGRLKTMDRYDIVLIHYIPPLCCSIEQFAPSPNASSDKDAGRLQDLIITRREHDAWALRNFQAAAKVLWLAEYSERFLDENGNVRTNVEDDSDGLERRSTLR